jgi:hypothetical protein
VKPAASTNKQPEGRADHVTAKATLGAGGPKLASISGGVWADFNPVLWGCGQYFCTSNAARRFVQLDFYVWRRLLFLRLARKGRSVKPGEVLLWTLSSILKASGYIAYAALSDTRSFPFESRVMLLFNRLLVSRVREICMHGLVGRPYSSCSHWAA